MYDQNGFDSSYSYTPRQGGDPWDQRPTLPQVPKKKKKGGAGKAVALVLCCALVGGGSGVGGAALYNAMTPPAAQSVPNDRDDQGDRNDKDDGSAIYRNETDPAAVQVKQADGLTPMSLSEINAAYADSCVCISVQATV